VIGVGVQTWGIDVTALRRYWQLADDLGYTRVTYGDGLGAWTHDGWTMLGAMALVTRRARLGPAVTYGFGPSSHHPSWLAKRAVAVDHLSGGRLDLRLGVGAEGRGSAGQWRAHGIDYPSARERVDRLEETVSIVRRLWRGEAVDTQGGTYGLRGARLAPRPLQRPGPPLWIAAMGPRALALTARLADGWEASYLSPPALSAKWRRVRSLLWQARRTPESLGCSVETDVVIARTGGRVAHALARFQAERRVSPRHALLATALIGTPTAVRSQARRFVRAGATDLMLGFSDFPETAMLELFAETVLPALRDVP
jgi:alkanesulfonate monooxygenase SsuD/methylene tetrahydromethanopterin reductase-like flavin-dependent oxidoreductase (luciferase family)